MITQQETSMPLAPEKSCTRQISCNQRSSADQHSRHSLERRGFDVAKKAKLAPTIKVKLTPEQRSDIAKKAAAKRMERYTPEQISQRAKKAAAARYKKYKPEEISQQAKKAAGTRKERYTEEEITQQARKAAATRMKIYTPEQRSQHAHKADSTNMEQYTHEERSQQSKKAAATRKKRYTSEEIAQQARKGAVARMKKYTPEQRSQHAHKAVSTNKKRYLPEMRSQWGKSAGLLINTMYTRERFVKWGREGAKARNRKLWVALDPASRHIMIARTLDTPTKARSIRTPRLEQFYSRLMKGKRSQRGSNKPVPPELTTGIEKIQDALKRKRKEKPGDGKHGKNYMLNYVRILICR